MNEQNKTIGIIAAAGEMPLDVARSIIDQGHNVFVIKLKDITTVDLSIYPAVELNIGQIGKMINVLKENNCHNVALVGKVHRPSLLSVKPDMRGAKIITKVLATSDDKALRLIRDEFAKDNINILDIADLMPKIYADEGVISGREPEKGEHEAIHLGIAFLSAVGAFDVGQGCIVQGERILALEGAEGTDNLLHRTAPFIDQDLSSAVFIKMLKPSQDPSLDPPGFGADTVRSAAASGIKMIALQAGAVIMIDKPSILEAAHKLGVSIFGFSREKHD